MVKDLFDIIRNIPLFTDINDESLRTYLPLFQLSSLKLQDILFQQQDRSDFMYVVLRGRLKAIHVDADGAQQTVGYIEPGEVVGELGAFSGELRSLTVVAEQDSELLALSASDFKNICIHHKGLMLEMMGQIIKRSQKVINLLSSSGSNKCIVVLPGNQSEVYSKVISFIEDVCKNNKNVSAHHPSVSEFKLNEPKCKTINIISKIGNDFSQYNFPESSDIYLICDASDQVSIDYRVVNKAKTLAEKKACKIFLVLVHNNALDTPRHTRHWLNILPFSRHHHLKLDSIDDIHRLLRFMIERPIGLVLGGGGFKGWVHVGVLKALIEHNIPIDYLGGTSIGAVAASIFAKTLSYDASVKDIARFSSLAAQGVSWRNLIFPFVSLYNGKKFTSAHHEVYEDLDLEDLWVPSFCMATNLTQQHSHVHLRGPLWKIIRSSTSLPGLLPPVVFEGELYVDGGVTNNLPIDIMRSQIGPKGIIIAVDLEQQGQSTIREYEFEPTVSFLDILLSKIGFANKSYLFPSYSELLLESLMMGASLKSQENILLADCLIKPNLLRYNQDQGRKNPTESLIQIGYQLAIEEINQSIMPLIKRHDLCLTNEE